VKTTRKLARFESPEQKVRRVERREDKATHNRSQRDQRR
jgi:hypothetical protein